MGGDEGRTKMEHKLQSLINDFNIIGERAIYDRCHDRGFCEAFELDYSSKTLYTDIKLLLLKGQK